ncbi:MAG: glycosyltransferase [Lachnospiraceae bacterium]|nr:glycosyltransferase [Lachnospiraceae bacterium]
MIITYLSAAVSLLLKVFSVWFFVTALLFWKRPVAYKRSAPKTRFACLIPARNEEAVIGALVKSLKEQNYPADLYEIYVIPNNCTDGTAEAATAAGAKIIRCQKPVTCKGDALKEALSFLAEEEQRETASLKRKTAGEQTEPFSERKFDAMCLFDADNVVHPDFLARMNDAFCAGAKVAKARLLVKNPRASWVSGCYSLYFAMNDTFFSRSRANFGLSAKLVGTGMAARREVLEKMGGWNTETIAEDAEFSAMCAEQGERVWWVPDAVTYDEAPVSFGVSLTQRKRWCSGIMTVAEKMVPRLLRVVGKQEEGTSVRAADMCFFLCTPFAQAASVIPGFGFFAGAITSGNLTALLIFLGLTLSFALGGMTGFAFWLRFLCGQRLRKSSVFLFPLFMASFVPLQVLSLLRRTKKWKTIKHYGV